MSSVWFQDPAILVDSRKTLEFIPTDSMTVAERNNALARLLMYITCIGYVFNESAEIFHLWFTGSIALALLYKYQTKTVNVLREMGITTLIPLSRDKPCDSRYTSSYANYMIYN